MERGDRPIVIFGVILDAVRSAEGAVDTTGVTLKPLADLYGVLPPLPVTL